MFQEFRTNLTFFTGIKSLKYLTVADKIPNRRQAVHLEVKKGIGMNLVENNKSMEKIRR